MSSGAKTHAFFASPFSSSSPSPPPPPPLSRQKDSQPNSAPPRSLTADFFATPFRSPSPPPLPKHPKSATTAPINLSRIFPSRYTKARETIDDYTNTYTSSPSTERASTSSSLLFSAPHSTTTKPKPKPEFLFFDFDSNRELRESTGPQQHHSAHHEDEDSAQLQLLTDGNVHFSRLNTSSLHPSSSPILLSSSASSGSLIYSYTTASSRSRSPSSTPSFIDSDSETDPRLPTPPRPPQPLPPSKFDSSQASLLEDETTPRPPDLMPSLKVTHLERKELDKEKLSNATSAAADRHDAKVSPVEDAPLGPGVIISSDPPRIFAPPPASGEPEAFLSPAVSPLSPTFNISSSPSSTHFHHSSPSPLFYSSPLPSSDHIQAQPPSRTGTPTPRSVSSSSSLPSAAPSSTSLKLVKPLGQGAFSSVWLAEDQSRIALALSSKKSVRDLRRAARASGEVSRSGSVKSTSQQLQEKESEGEKEKDKKHEGLSILSLSLSRNGSLKKFRERIVGTRPPTLLGRMFLDERHGEMGVPSVANDTLSPPPSSLPLSREGSTSSHGHTGTGSNAPSRTTSLKRRRSNLKKTRLVAVKLTPRRVAAYSVGGKLGKDWEKEEEERTRVGFVREVEVLRHISHPNITPLLTHLSTPTHHVLVLPYLDGGDLHGLVNNDIAWSKLSESVMRRIWCEVCKAVGWMHGVGLVHRDIKLENILLTTSAFSALTESSPRPKLSDLPESPAPFIKISDFGLSRFVEIDENGDAELLSTRCGSEAYAAPEMIINGGGSRSKDGKGVYDARETDAWACGVVLYALVARCLPFGEGPGMDVPGKIGDERMRYGAARRSAAERRGWLMKIASGQWEWPTLPEDAMSEEEEELVGRRLVLSEGAKRIVGRLLVRDARKRARICELWEDEWMLGGALGMEINPLAAEEAEDDISSDMAVEDEPVLDDVDDEDMLAEDEMEFADDVDEDEEDGLLLDQEGIDNIARREVI